MYPVLPRCCLTFRVGPDVPHRLVVPLYLGALLCDVVAVPGKLLPVAVVLWAHHLLVFPLGPLVLVALGGHPLLPCVHGVLGSVVSAW